MKGKEIMACKGAAHAKALAEASRVAAVQPKKQPRRQFL